jgi:hypothetical protein
VGRADRWGRRHCPCGIAAVTDRDDVALKIYLYSRAQSVMGGTSQIQKNIIATRIPRPSGDLIAPRTERSSMDYPLPPAVRVEVDGPVRIVRLSRPTS